MDDMFRHIWIVGIQQSSYHIQSSPYTFVTFLLKVIDSFYFPCMGFCLHCNTPYAYSVMEIRRRHWISWNWGYRQY